MANYIKIRDLDSYSTNAAGAVTGIYTGDYMALASRLPSNGGLESVQNTRRATIADTIRLYNEAQTIADAIAAAPDGTSADQIQDELADVTVQLDAPLLTTAWDPLANDGAGECRVTNDPSLTARTFSSVIELGQGLSYTATLVPGSTDAQGCSDYTYSLGLTPVSDVTSTTFILFIGRNEYLDNAANYGAGVLANWQATDNVLTNVVESTSPTVQGTGNYLLYGSGNLNGPGWMRTSFQGATWSGNPLSHNGAENVPVSDAELSPRALIDTTQVLESGVMDISAGVNEVTTLNKVLQQAYGYGGYANAKCVANPFISLDSACTYATNNFDLASSTIVFWIRGDGPQGNMSSVADRAAIAGSPVGRTAFTMKNIHFVSPVAGKPRKINYDFGPKTSTNVTLPFNPIANRTLVWQWYSYANYVALTNVHFKMFGLGQSQQIAHVGLNLFRYAGTSNTKWDNSIIDWSDSSNERPDGQQVDVANQIHQNYDSATVNYAGQFANYSSGMRAAQNAVYGISDYDDYSRFRPAIEYITNRNVRFGSFTVAALTSLQRNYTFRPNNYSIGGLANQSSNTIHSWQRFRDGTAGAKEGFYFSTWMNLNNAAHVYMATPYVVNSATYRDKSRIDYATTNNGNTSITLVDWGLANSTVPFKPSAALGCGDMIITKTVKTEALGTVYACTGYGVVSVMVTGTTYLSQPFNYLDGSYNGANACIRQVSDSTSMLVEPGEVQNTVQRNHVPPSYPPTAMGANGVDGWIGRVTGGYTSTMLNGYGAVPLTSLGSGPLLRQCAYPLVAQDTVAPETDLFPIFTGISWMDNTLVKYLDDPYPYYTNHTDVHGTPM